MTDAETEELAAIAQGRRLRLWSKRMNDPTLLFAFWQTVEILLAFLAGVMTMLAVTIASDTGRSNPNP